MSGTKPSEVDLQSDAVNCLATHDSKEHSQSRPWQPASCMVASASADGTVKVWQVGQGNPVCSMDFRNDQDNAALTSLAMCSATTGCVKGGKDMLFVSNFSGEMHLRHVDQLDAK